jgi:hypothetical protein
MEVVSRLVSSIYTDQDPFKNSDGSPGRLNTGAFMHHMIEKNSTALDSFHQKIILAVPCRAFYDVCQVNSSAMLPTIGCSWLKISYFVRDDR